MTQETVGETRGSSGDGRTTASANAAAELICALECERPAALSVRHRLAGIDRIELGRGNSRSATRREGVLTITVPDARMSAQHAQIEKSFGRWVFVDHDSKNGSLVNGAVTYRAELVDGDLIELGRTLFFFREGVVREPSEPAELDLDLESKSVAISDTLTMSAAFQAELDKLKKLAVSEVPLLLLGESGTGKEVLARAFHRHSNRPGEMVAVNCGAIPESLIESELFGHRKGSFSGAVSDSPGLFRAADNGTLFLDEIGDLPLASQAVLLRALQEREVRPVGGTRAISVNIRLVAATHRELADMVAQGTFRDDLYARVSGFRIAVPPLRERRDDLGLLIGSILVRLATELGRDVPRLTIETARRLYAHTWPLNIRELETTLRAALVLAPSDRLETEHLPVDLREEAPEPAPSRPLNASELEHRDQLIELLDSEAGNISAVARRAGKDRKQIHRWLKRYGLDPDRFRS